jgi:4-amino-4-deoxy-L-arabinose transferase-like glycosyltransferase
VRANGELVAGLAVHLTLLAAPGIAAAVLAARQGVRNVVVQLGIALAASGLAAFASFWAFYAGPTVGRVWDFLLLAACVAVVVWVWREGRIEWRALRPLAVPLGLWVLGSCFVTFLGFLHGGTDNAIPMSALRFSGQLPSDNDIPRYFTEWFASHGHQNPPPVYPPDWLMSDRPPLQVGYALSQRAFLPTERALHYELLCIGVQSFWIVGMWAVLLAARLRLWTRGLAMFAAMVSDVAILHGFFVWPKLIAAAFLLAALAIVISPAWSRDRHSLGVAALVGALLALAMLSHGSSVFGVIPLALLAAWRGMPSRRWIGVAAVVLIALMLPWTAYQKWANPPGDRLLKWQLGGELTVNDKGTLDAIVDGYEEEGLDGTVDNKVDNFGEIAGWPRAENEFEAAVDGIEEGKPGIAAAAIRGLRFFSLLPFLGLLLVAPVAMLIARRRAGREEDEWRFALVCFGFFALACLVWGLLLFGTPDSRATIHVGSLAVPLLGLIGCVVGMRSVFPRAATALVGVNVFCVLLLYAPSLTPEPGTSYSPIAALLALASLAGFARLCFAEDEISSQGIWSPKGGGEVGTPASSSPAA